MNSVLKERKKLNFISYSILCLICLFIIYLSLPKLLNFSFVLIKKDLKNNNINIENISKAKYQIFPTPRLSIPYSDFTIGDEIARISSSELEFILEIRSLLNSQKINYRKLFINNGTIKVNLNNINELLSSLNKVKKELIFKNNNLIFLHKGKVFLEINDALLKIRQFEEKKELIINGKFLDNKIFIKLDSSLKNKNNLTLKIPGLDIATKVFFENKTSGGINGSFNLEVYNNFLKFNFIKEDNLKLKDGFIRSKIANSSLEGEINFKPNFFSKIDFKISNLNVEKLFPLIKKNYFSANKTNISLIKKINGIFNFKSKFTGTVINRNGEILFENFKIGKTEPIIFNAKIFEFGEKSKVQFNLVKIVEYKRNLQKKIEIKGFLIPSSTKVIFQKFILDGNELSVEETTKLQKKFENKVVQDSLANIFNKSKTNKFLKNLF
jgi:hypothetical protein